MAYFKSLLWLLGSSALGYTLMLITAPDERIVKEKFRENPDRLKHRQAVVETLRLAADNNNPMYRQTKQEIETDIKKK